MDNINKAEAKFFITALKEEARDVLHQVGSNVSPDDLVNSCLDDLQALAKKENDNRSEEEIQRQLRERLLLAAYATRPYCVRCGTCCTKGSPSLVVGDLETMKKGFIQPHHLVTIREDEDIYDQIGQQVTGSPREFIKIKEQPDSSTCIFFEKSNNTCAIYEDRPEQCKSQECWDPQNPQDRDDWLDRKALLKDAGPVWDIIQKHEEKCSHTELKRALSKLGATRGQTVEELLELLRYDHYVREWVKENFKIDSDTLNFFFGRPLKEGLFAYGLKLEEEPDGCFLLSAIEAPDSES